MKCAAVKAMMVDALGNIGTVKKARFRIQVGDGQKAAGQQHLVKCRQQCLDLIDVVQHHIGRDQVVARVWHGIVREIKPFRPHVLQTTGSYLVL